MSATVQEASVVWVVVDRSGEVVLMCSGRDATEVADDWAARGFDVVALAADEVYAA